MNGNTKNFNDWWEETGQHLPLNPLDTAREAWDAATENRPSPASTPPAPAAGLGITAKFREAMAAAVALGEIDEDSARYAADVLGCVVMDASESIVSEVLAVLCPEGHDPEEHDQVQEAVVNGLVGPAEPPAYGNRDSTELEEDARTAGPTQSAIPPLPEGMSREQAVLALRDLRDLATAAQAEADPGFKRWPTLDALIDHVAVFGLPPNTERSGGKDRR